MKVRLFVLVIVATVAFVFRSIASAPNPMFIPAYVLIGLGLLSLGTGAIAYRK
ncbi:MAG: hypothetical protein JSV36_13770 [Anaerolineae bacterium]|nr:MAG: hypothetical protein JSV36_13770 [Anaerolineae bacterium]